MASFSLRILFVEDEAPAVNDIFTSEAERFHIITTSIPPRQIAQLPPRQAAENYDLVVFDRRSSSNACPEYLRHWIHDLLAVNLDVLLLIGCKDSSLDLVLEENNASEATVSYLINPISPFELKMVMHRQEKQRKMKLLLDETNRVATQITLRAAQMGPDGLEEALAEVVASTCRAAVQIVGVDHSGCVRFEWDEATGHYGDHAVLLADYPIYIDGTNESIEIPVRDVPVEEALLNECKPIAIEDVRTYPGLGPVRDLLLKQNILSTLLVPVVVNGRVVASFSLDSTFGTCQFSSDDIDLCQNLARQAGLTIAKIEKELEAGTMRRAWQAAQRIAQIAAQGNVDETMQCIVNAITHELKGDIATLYIFDDDREVNRFVLRYVDSDCPILDGAEPYLVSDKSSPGRMIRLEGTDHHFSEDAPNDPIFGGAFVQANHIQTSFGMQLRYGSQKMGVMFINYHRRKHFKAYEINSFLAFGYQAAVSIKTALLSQQSNRQRTMLDNLYTADEINPDENTVEEALRRITRVAQETIAGPEGGENAISHIALVQGNQLKFHAAWPPENLDVLNSHSGDVCMDPIHPKSLAAKAVMEGKTLLEQNAAGLDYYIPCFPGFNAQISVPLSIGQAKIGVLTVEKKTPPLITQLDKENLEHLAGHATAAIRASRHLKLVTSLLTAWSRMPLLEGQQDSERLLLSIADVVRETFNCDQVAIYSYDQTRDMVTFPAIISGGKQSESTFYHTLKHAPNQRMAINSLSPNSSIRRLIRSGHNEFAQDARQSSTLKNSNTIKTEGIQSTAAILLKIRGESGDGRTLGVLFLNFCFQRSFQAEEQNEIQLFAQSIAYALYNVQVSQEMAYRQGYFQDQNWLTQSQKCWSDKMDECVDGILSTIQAIHGNLEEITPRVPVLTEIEKKLHDMTTLTSDIDRITHIPNQGLGMRKERVEVNRLVEDRVKAIWKREWDNMSYLKVGDNHHVSRAIDPVYAQVDPEWLRYVIDLVVDIAVDHVSDCAEKSIEVSVVPDPDQQQVKIFILDSHSIAQDDEEKLGQELEQNVQWRVARTILRTYQGELSFEMDEQCRGTLFILELPLSPSLRHPSSQPMTSHVAL